jgi:hypothetical protein
MRVPETHEGDRPEPSKRNYLLKAGGSGTGTTDNPALGAIGVVLRDPHGQLVEEISRPIGPAINTVAEYRALIEGSRSPAAVRARLAPSKSAAADTRLDDVPGARRSLRGRHPTATRQDARGAVRTQAVARLLAQ